MEITTPCTHADAGLEQKIEEFITYSQGLMDKCLTLEDLIEEGRMLFEIRENTDSRHFESWANTLKPTLDMDLVGVQKAIRLYENRDRIRQGIFFDCSLE